MKTPSWVDTLHVMDHGIRIVKWVCFGTRDLSCNKRCTEYRKYGEPAPRHCSEVPNVDT